MKIVIAGGSGFLGRSLAASLVSDGHQVVVLARHSPQVSGLPAGVRLVVWDPSGQAGHWAVEVDGADAVINLAGEPIAARRWTAAQKARISDSRIRATRSLVASMAVAAAGPPIFVSGSAVGYYGPMGDEVVDEMFPAGRDFLAGVCAQWEAEALHASASRTRVVLIRTGLVLERDGGALMQMLPAFKWGAGGAVGSGQQYWPWIHREDWVGLVRWAMSTSNISGPLNATAPNPVPSAEFARALGDALHRPAFMRAPAIGLKILFGEMADALLLSGQRAVPARALASGFVFRFATIDDALRAVLR